MTTLGGVHHVSLNVDDVEAAGAFYEDVLGLRRIDRPDFGVPGRWLDAGGVQIHLIERKDYEAPVGQHIAFHVDDVAAAHARLVDRGVDATRPKPLPGAGLQTFLWDPAGNLIELLQPDPPA